MDQKEKRKQYYKKYYEENIEKERARGKAWYNKQDKKLLYQKRKARQLELGHTNYYDRPERCFKMYERNAKKANRDFSLTLAFFSTFWQKPCFYCGEDIDTIGIDRIDNSIGYIEDNIVSCCKLCNLMKRSLSQKEFLLKCRKISQLHEAISKTD